MRKLLRRMARFTRRGRRDDPGSFECHAALLARFHTRYGIVPDYEHILECSYRSLIPAGTTVIDVGAHGGRHTAIFSDLVGPDGVVVAFEPLPHLVASLQDREFGCQVQIHACALSDFSGRSSFTHMRGTPGESGLRERISNYPQQADPVSIDVEVRQLDEFLSDIVRLSFIKIDIEGGEVACLRGGSRLLKHFRPFISVEYRRAHLHRVRADGPLALRYCAILGVSHRRPIRCSLPELVHLAASLRFVVLGLVPGPARADPRMAYPVEAVISRTRCLRGGTHG